MVFAQFYSQGPSQNGFGTITGSVGATQFPNIPTLLVRFKAGTANTPVVYVGTAGNANYPLAAGDDTGWFACNNLNQFYYRNTGTIHFWYQA